MNETADGIVRIHLQKKLDTAAADDLLSNLRDAQGQDVSLDASGVEVLGGRCFEILLDARHHWASASRTFQVADPSPKMVEDLGRFGALPEMLQSGDV